MDKQNIPDDYIGRNIARLREQAKLTQDQLAAKLQTAEQNYDLSRGTLGKVEAGYRHIYAYEIVRIRAILQVSYEDLLDPPPEPEGESR